MDTAALYLKVNSKEVSVGTVSLTKLQKASTSAAKSIDKVTDSSNRAAKGTKVMASEMSSSFKIVGRDLSRYVTLPFLAASAASLKFSKDLSTGMGSVEALIAGTGSRIYELQDAVTTMASETGVGFSELTRGLYETISAFQDGADTVGRFEAAVRSSVAGNATVLDSVKLISAVTKAYGDTSEEAAVKVTDLAFSAVKYGQTTFSELANAIQSVTANSDRLGVSQEELFSVYATLTGVTGNAAEVTTQFNRALLSLSNPTSELQGLFAKYSDAQGEAVTTGKQFIEVTGGAVNAFKEIYDASAASGEPLEKYITRQTGVIAVTALANKQFDTFVEKSKRVEESVGEMDKAYYATTLGINEFQFQLKQVAQTLASVGADIGNILLPTFVVIGRQIATLATNFEKLDDSTKKMAISFIAAAAAAGPLLIAFGSFLRLYKTVLQLKELTNITSMATLFSKLALNIPLLIAVVATISAVVLIMGKWWKATKRQIDALEALREASIGVADANTEFIKMVNSFDELNKGSDINAEMTRQLITLYPSLRGVINETTSSVSDLYDEMLKLEAFEYQSQLAPQIEQLGILNNEMLDDMSARTKTLARLGGDYGDVLDDLGTTALGALEKYKTSPEAFNEVFAQTPIFGDLLFDLKNVQESIADQGDGLSTFLDDLQKDIESRTGGLLTLDRTIGAEIKVIPNTVWEDPTAIEDGLDLLLGGSEDKEARLKTWEDYFSEITGIAGQAFAHADIDEGKIVGFSRGAGALAASAYSQAFTNELDLTTAISSAIGDSFSAGDKAGVLESQIDTAVSDLTSLLSKSVSELNKEGLDFSVSDLLTGDAKSVEEMIQVFDIADTGIQGIITEINNLKTAHAESILLQAPIDIAKAYEDLAIQAESMKGVFGQDMFNTEDGGFDTAMSNVETLNDLIAESKGDSSGLVLLRDEELEKAREFSITLSNIMSDLEAAPSLGDQFATSMFDAFKSSEEGAENFNMVLASATTIMGGFMDVAIDGLTTMVYELGQASAGVGDWNDALGNLASTLASTLSNLAIQVGLQLISAGAVKLAQNDATGWGLVAWGGSMMAGGLAGQYAQGYTEGVTEENAKGGVYEGNVKKFAKGGALSDFSNSIVRTPTYFANGAGLMGEAGAEGILPLSRASNGELGVQASGMGGSGTVNVTIINNGSDEATVTESTDSSGGTDITVTIGRAMASAIAGGKVDSAMKARYGTSVKGLN